MSLTLCGICLPGAHGLRFGPQEDAVPGSLLQAKASFHGDDFIVVSLLHFSIKNSSGV